MLMGTFDNSISIPKSCELVELVEPRPVFIERAPTPSIDEPVLEKMIITETFYISSSIEDINAFLTGPPQHNMMKAEYLELIGELTMTECILENRMIIIRGHDKDSVNDALSKFSLIENTFVACGEKTIVPCIHYPEESEPYKLFFCSLSDYKYTTLIPCKGPNLFVILPVFYNKQKQDYDIPKNMIPPRQYQQQKRPPVTHEEFSFVPPPVISKPPQRPFSISPSEFRDSWGLDRNFRNVHISKETSMVDFPQAFQSPPSPSISSVSLYDSPNLSTPALSCTSSVSTIKKFNQPYRPSLSKKKSTQNCVLRIVPQKSSYDKSLRFSQLKMAKEYNLNNIKYALNKGLDAVRGYRGEVSLSIKLGKLMWTNVDQETCKTLWNFHDLKDIVIGEMNVSPLFKEKITDRALVIDEISTILPTYYKRQGVYEFHCSVRNQRRTEYENIVLHMKEGIVQVNKVVYSEKTISEVDWISLDRQLDFQMSLKIRDLIRTDVKPFTTFVKSISLNAVTRVISFEEVHDFLYVKNIYWKETTKHRINQHVIEVTRVEKLYVREEEMNEYQNKRQFIAEAEGKDVWFEVEIFDTSHTDHFEQNKHIDIGSLAPWCKTDILGENDTELVKFIACALSFVEYAESKIMNIARNI